LGASVKFNVEFNDQKLAY